MGTPVTTALGLCAGPRLCDRPGVAYLYRTNGPNARLTVVTGPRAATLSTGTAQGLLAVRCRECVVEELDTLLDEAAR